MEIGECQVPDLTWPVLYPRDDPDYVAVVRPFRVASGEAKTWRYVLLRMAFRMGGPQDVTLSRGEESTPVFINR